MARLGRRQAQARLDRRFAGTPPGAASVSLARERASWLPGRCAAALFEAAEAEAARVLASPAQPGSRRQCSVRLSRPPAGGVERPMALHRLA